MPVNSVSSSMTTVCSNRDFMELIRSPISPAGPFIMPLGASVAVVGQSDCKGRRGEWTEKLGTEKWPNRAIEDEAVMGACCCQMHLPTLGVTHYKSIEPLAIFLSAIFLSQDPLQRSLEQERPRSGSDCRGSWLESWKSDAL